MKQFKFIIICLLFLSVIFTSTEKAFAKKNLKITNHAGTPIYTAVRYQDYREGPDGGVWATVGWYKTDSYKTNNITLYTDNATFYVYTYQSNTLYHTMEWGGSVNDSRDNAYWVYSGKMYLQGQSKPQGDNVRKKRFKRYYVPKNSHHITYER